MAVTIRGRTLSLPILQGGMGVGISLERLAGAVAACGGMGTISTAVAGFNEPDDVVAVYPSQCHDIASKGAVLECHG